MYSQKKKHRQLLKLMHKNAKYTNKVSLSLSLSLSIYIYIYRPYYIERDQTLYIYIYI